MNPVSSREITKKKDQTLAPAFEPMELFSAEEFEDFGLKGGSIRVKPLTEGLGFHHEQIKLGDTQYISTPSNAISSGGISSSPSVMISNPQRSRSTIPLERKPIDYTSIIVKPAPIRNTQINEENILKTRLEFIILAEILDISLVLLLHFISFLTLFFVTKEEWSFVNCSSFYRENYVAFLVYTLLYYLSYQMIFNATSKGSFGKRIFHFRLERKNKKVLSLKNSLYHACLMLASFTFLGVPFFFGFPFKMNNTHYVQK